MTGNPFQVGDLAEHKDGMDPRTVLRVEGEQIWLDIMGSEAGPFPAENYDRQAATASLVCGHAECIVGLPCKREDPGYWTSRGARL